MRERIAALSGGIAVIRVGDTSESRMAEGGHANAEPIGVITNPAARPKGPAYDMSMHFEELDYRPTPLGPLSLRCRDDPRLGEVFEIKLGRNT